MFWLAQQGMKIRLQDLHCIHYQSKTVIVSVSAEALTSAFRHAKIKGRVLRRK